MKRIILLLLPILLLLLVSCTPEKEPAQTTSPEQSEPESAEVTLPKIEGIETDENGGFILPTIPI